MRRLAEAPDELLREVRGVVFDIDDTVTRSGRLEARAFDAMWALHRSGIALVAVTGRPCGWAEVIARHWPLAAAVFENGAGYAAWSEGRDATVRFVDDDATRAAQAAVLDRVKRRVAAELPDVRLAEDQGARRADVAFDVAERVRLDAATVRRIVSLIESEGARALVSSVQAHVLAGDWDKPRGACLAIRETLGIDVERERERFVFVGDSGNDAAAFAWFPFSVGVANVRDHAASIATMPAWVTEADRGEGFAEVAARILAAKR